MMARAEPRFAVIVPAHNAQAYLRDCLDGLRDAGFDLAGEVCVVDDGSVDQTGQIARDLGAQVIVHGVSKGAAGARRAGAQGTQADILVFVDADVCVAPDARTRLVQAFDAPKVAAVFGAYDEHPAAPGLVSQYRNLLHRYVHLTSAGPVHSFWTGLGAVRRAAYEAVGGIDAAQRMMEDVEFGMRLSAHGYAIQLDPLIEGTHLKRWTLAGMIKTDLFDRAIPWSRLIARHPAGYSGLNLSRARKAAAVAAAGVGLGLISLPFGSAGVVLLALSLLAFIGLSWPFLRWLAGLRGVAFAIGAVVPHLLHNWCALAGFVWVRLGR